MMPKMKSGSAVKIVAIVAAVTTTIGVIAEVGVIARTTMTGGGIEAIMMAIGLATIERTTSLILPRKGSLTIRQKSANRYRSIRCCG
jgi:hypothetical protein